MRYGETEFRLGSVISFEGVIVVLCLYIGKKSVFFQKYSGLLTDGGDVIWGLWDGGGYSYGVGSYWVWVTDMWAFIIFFYGFFCIFGIFYYKKLKKWVGKRRGWGGVGGVLVVGGREDGDIAVVVRYFVVFGFDFVVADDVVQVVFFQEGFGDVGFKLVVCISFVDRAFVLGRQGVQNDVYFYLFVLFTVYSLQLLLWFQGD